MVKRKSAALLPTNLALLQNVIKRDPGSYRDEFLLQYRHYESQKDIFMANPSVHKGDEFTDLISFVTQVCVCYPTETSNFPEELASLLVNHHAELESGLREKVVQSLVSLRNRDVISGERLSQVLFPVLISTKSKTLRAQIYTGIVSLLRSANRGTKAQKLNRKVQAILFNLLLEQDGAGLWATRLTRELWKRNIWDDSKAVEIIKQAALLDDTKVACSAAWFFLGADKDREESMLEDDDSMDEEDIRRQVGSFRHKMGINKKNPRTEKKVQNALRNMKKKGQNKDTQVQLNFSAIHLLHDPQGFAEQLFDKHLAKSSNRRVDIEQKILFLTLISRLVGVHKLTVLGIYTFVLKYLTPRQPDVTKFMACTAQASHDLVPPDMLQPIVRKIADEFVSEGVAAEVAAAGINTIREICARAPLAMDSTLLQDLTEYKGSKSKTVMMAARSLISLYREIAPEMLSRKDRGKEGAISLIESRKATAIEDSKSKPVTGLKFGQQSVLTSIPGIELLQNWRKSQGLDDVIGENGELMEEDEDEAWQVLSEDSDSESEDGWIQVESDKEYDISDDSSSSSSSDDEDGDKETTSGEGKKEEEKSADDIFADLASRKILTPADFAKLQELRVEAELEKSVGSSKRAKTTNKKVNGSSASSHLTNKHEEAVDASELLGDIKYRESKEEKKKRAQEGREDREFGSRKGKINKEHSTTNKEKARKKNIMMMIHKRDVVGKSRRSLRDKQRVLRAHITKQKKKGF